MQRSLCVRLLVAACSRPPAVHRAADGAKRRRLTTRAAGDNNALPPELAGGPQHLDLRSTVFLAPRSLSARLGKIGVGADLRITEDGLLIDEKTGEVINEHTGATRFDVAVRALRGDFDPPPGAANTERAAGLLMDSLVQWPAVYDFQFVLRCGDAEPGALADEMRAVVEGACGVRVDAGACTAKERKGGKFVSVTVPALVRAPGVIQKVFAAVEADTRIIMKY